jgi:hypothetical protein
MIDGVPFIRELLTTSDPLEMLGSIPKKKKKQIVVDPVVEPDLPSDKM